jgi:hypothetical protein
MVAYNLARVGYELEGGPESFGARAHPECVDWVPRNAGGTAFGTATGNSVWVVDSKVEIVLRDVDPSHNAFAAEIERCGSQTRVALPDNEITVAARGAHRVRATALDPLAGEKHAP